MGEYDKIIAGAFAGIGALMFIVGIAFAIDAQMMMSAVEAAGPIGQAAEFDAYRDAGFRLTIASVVAASGLALMILFSAGYVAATIRDLAK